MTTCEIMPPATRRIILYTSSLPSPSVPPPPRMPYGASQARTKTINMSCTSKTPHTGKGPTTAALSAARRYQLTLSTVFALATFVQGRAFVPASTSPLMLSYAASQHLSGSVLLLEKGCRRKARHRSSLALRPAASGAHHFHVRLGQPSETPES